MLQNNLLRFIPSKARYLIRLDDACPTQNKEKWEKIEHILDANEIRPIVALIPQNRDEELEVSESNQNFWEEVHKWKQKNWDIAQHGYQHKFHQVKKTSLILPFHPKSEFGELPIGEQKRLLEAGRKLLKNKKIHPKIWVAPAHSFDKNTLLALKMVTDIRVVSDGISLFPYEEDGFHYIPQQLWWPAWRPFGIWTICIHPNTMTSEQIKNFGTSISLLNKKVISVDEALSFSRKRGILCRLFSLYFWLKWDLSALKKRYQTSKFFN